MKFTLLQITIVSSILFSILMLISVPFVFMVRKLFFKISRIKIFSYYSLFLIFYIFIMFVTRDSLLFIERNILYYLGFLNFALFVSIVFWIVYFISYFFKKTDFVIKMKYFWIGVIILLSLISIYNFEKEIVVESFDITSNKVSKEYNFVHITDTQYGTVDLNHVMKAFNLAIKQGPDFILFTGDFVDFEGYEKEDFDFIESIDVPIYFVRGNHEFYHDEIRLLSILEDSSSIELLINNKTSFEELEFVGIDYSRDKKIVKKSFDSIDVDEDSFSILLYHDPRYFDFILNDGYNLVLAGHTHGGQIFPITYFMDFIYPYWNGYYVEGNTHIYTSDGAGLWGPRMRLGSQNEIAYFRILPE